MNLNQKSFISLFLILKIDDVSTASLLNENTGTNILSDSSSSLAIQTSIGGAIIQKTSTGDNLHQLLYFNSENSLSQPQLPIINEMRQTDTDGLYHNSEATNSRNLRESGSRPTAAPISTEGKSLAPPTVDIINGNIANNKNVKIIDNNKKSFKYEKPSKIEPYNTVLNNGREFPMVGIGAGNIARQKIPLMINEALYSVRLVDTSKAQSNESLVARSILRWLKSQPKVKDFDSSEHVIHITTKVWYTHLDYERTSKSVLKSKYSKNKNNLLYYLDKYLYHDEK